MRDTSAVGFFNPPHTAHTAGAEATDQAGTHCQPPHSQRKHTRAPERHHTHGRGRATGAHRHHSGRGAAGGGSGAAGAGVRHGQAGLLSSGFFLGGGEGGDGFGRGWGVPWIAAEPMHRYTMSSSPCGRQWSSPCSLKERVDRSWRVRTASVMGQHLRAGTMCVRAQLLSPHPQHHGAFKYCVRDARHLLDTVLVSGQRCERSPKAISTNPSRTCVCE